MPNGFGFRLGFPKLGKFGLELFSLFWNADETDSLRENADFRGFYLIVISSIKINASPSNGKPKCHFGSFP